MKHIQPYKIFEDKKEGINSKGDIKRLILEKDYIIDNCIINDNLSVDADEVYLGHCLLENIPFKFNSIKDSFYISSNFLTNLKNSPNKIGGDFICSYNSILSLKNFPSYVGGRISMYDNPIYLIVSDFINNDNKNELVSEFNHYRIIEDDKLYLERLTMFCGDFNLDVSFLNNIRNIEKFYKVI